MTRRREGVLAAAFCLALASALLLLASQCSPLYPINVWVDANCLLTVGRAMKAGAVLYRDIYEQKGPTLYLIHMLAAQLSDSSFLGVYVLEALSLAATLFLAYRLMRRRLEAPYALSGAALMGAGILVSSAFFAGDSAEEFCLPYLMAALCIAMRAYEQEEGPMRPRQLLLCGLMAGVVATIKYTVLGLFIGLCAAEGVAALRKGGLRRALGSAGAFLAGMAAPILLWIGYFAAEGALGDACVAYLYNNIFLYAGEAGAFSIRALVRYVFNNALWALPAALGVAVVCACSRGQARLAALLMGAGALGVVVFLGRLWPYCPLALSVFAALGWQALLEAAQKGLSAWRARRTSGACPYAGAFLVALCCAAALGLCARSPNAPLREQSLGELAQGRLASFVPEGASLLQYKHLDDGLYLATGTVPEVKYFVRLNVRDEQMLSEMDRYLEEGIPDYVLSSWDPLPERFENYQLIAEDAGYDDLLRINKMLYLYRKRGI